MIWEVLVNNTVATVNDGTAASGTYKAVGNEVNTKNIIKKTAELHIKKSVDGTIVDSELLATVAEKKFTYRVFFWDPTGGEDGNGGWRRYEKAPYGVKDNDGNYYEISAGDDAEKNIKKGDYVKRTTDPTKFYAAAYSGENGTISDIPDNLTVVIQGLVPETKFMVVEDDPSGKGYLWESYSVVNAGETQTTATADSSQESRNEGISGLVGKMKDSNHNYLPAEVTVTNKLENISLRKTDNSENALNGAEFKLYYINNEGIPVLIKSDTRDVFKPTIKESQNTGGSQDAYSEHAEVSITGLPVGVTYKLEESKAPNGYVILNKGIYFKIDREGNVFLCDIYGIPIEETPKLSYKLSANNSTGSAIITVANTPGKELPSTGGPGTKVYTILGLLLMEFAGALLAGKRRFM